MIRLAMQMLNTLSRCFQVIPMMLVIFSNYQLKYKYKKTFFLICVFIIGTIDSLVFEKGHNFTLYFFISFAVLLFWAAIFFDGWFFLKCINCLILSVCRTFLLPLGDAVAVKIFSAAVQPLSGFPHIVSQGIVAIALFPVAGFLIKYKIAPHNPKSPSLIRIVLLLMSIITLNQLFLVQTIEDAVTNVAYNICMVLIVCISYYFIYSLVQGFYREIKYSVEIEQLNMEKTYEEELQRNYLSLKKLRHDFRNHILCIGLMLQQKEYVELEQYCTELSEKIYVSPHHIDTGNLIANAILNQKYLQALSRNIPVEIHATLPQIIHMQKMELCSLLSNLFDNAIEASGCVKKPLIRIEIRPEKNYLFILFENTANLSRIDHSKTTKENKEEHGLGLGIVDELVKKYNGIMDISQKEDSFQVKILLQI